MAKNRLTLHLLQFSSIFGEPLKTLRRLQHMLGDFTPGRGEWLVMPEMWPSGLKPGDHKKQKVENAFCFHWLKNYARKNHCYLAGSMLEMPKNRAYNSAYLINPDGKLLTRYRKIHLFRLMQEHRRMTAGREVQVCRLPWGRVGLAICFDLRFPELFRKMSEKGAKMMVIPSAWPRERIDHMLALAKARAIENQCFVAVANKNGKETTGINYGGRSVVFGPWGENLGEMGSRNDILSVSIDLDEVDRVRGQYPFLKSRVLL
jgi:predicted amidohydrolase